MSAGYLRDHAAGCTLAVRAQPGAKKTAITGIYGEGDSAAVKVAVQAPPVEGRANEVLIAYLAELFEMPRSTISILHGELGRSKLVLLGRMTVERARVVVDACLSGNA